MLSSSCSIFSRDVTLLVSSSKRSANVLLPWSMCAIMQKFLMSFMKSVKVTCRCRHLFNRTSDICAWPNPIDQLWAADFLRF